MKMISTWNLSRRYFLLIGSEMPGFVYSARKRGGRLKFSENPWLTLRDRLIEKKFRFSFKCAREFSSFEKILPARYQGRRRSSDNTDGQNLIHHQERDYTLLVFACGQKKRNNVTVPFTYLGPVDRVSYESERPIKMVWRLMTYLTVSLNLFSSLSRAPGAVWTEATRRKAPHKPLLLLAVLDLMHRGVIAPPFIAVSGDLVELNELFNLYWRRIIPLGQTRSIAEFHEGTA